MHASGRRHALLSEMMKSYRVFRLGYGFDLGRTNDPSNRKQQMVADYADVSDFEQESCSRYRDCRLEY